MKGQRKRKKQVQLGAFSYKKLVVPVSMRSVFWKYFGFPADENGEILSRDYIVCNICQNQIRNNHNTTNLRIHLSNRHPQLLTELQALSINTEQPEKLKSNKSDKKKSHSMETCIEGVVKIMNEFSSDDTNNKKHFSAYENTVPTCKTDRDSENDNLHNEQDDTMQEFYLQPDESDELMDNYTICEIITKFIVMDMLPPDIVNGSGFLLLIATLQPTAEIPSVEKVEQEFLSSLYNDTKIGVIERISELKHQISLSIEEWTSCNERKYVTFYINYVESESSVIQSRVLKTIQSIEDSDLDYWSENFDNVCSEFNISIEMISAVVCGWCDDVIIKAVESKGITVIPCTIQTIQMCAEACFKDALVKNLMNKLLSDLSVIRDEDEDYEDYRSVWLSTYALLERSMQRKNSLELRQKLNEEEWQIIKDVLALLSPLKTTIITLSENKLPTISVIKPIMWQLISSRFKQKPTDNKLSARLKNIVSRILTSRSSEEPLSLFLTTAAFLDARFKLLPYAPKSELELVRTNVLAKMKFDLVEKGVYLPNKNKKKLSGMEMLLGKLYTEPKNERNPEAIVSQEFTMFKNEPAVCLDQCPLEWWLNNGNKYPNMMKVALPYLCIPVCSIGLERMSWKKAISYQNRRAALGDHVLDKILFVNSHY